MKSRVKKSLILLAIGVAVNIALALVKLYVGLAVNSLTIKLDAVNSFFDILTCIITIVAFIVLLIPRKESAPHGYGRSEYLAGFIVAAVSVVVGGVFFIQSLNRMAMPEPVYFGWESCVLISIGVPIKLAMGLFYYFVNRKLHSKALAAIMLDSFLDTVITTASVISFAISSNVNYAVDAIFGIILSVVIIIFAIKLVWDSVRSVVLGDRSDEEKQEIISLIESEDSIERVLDVDMHDYGYGAKAAVAKVVFKDGVTLQEAEIIIDSIRGSILAKGGTDVAVVPSQGDGPVSARSGNESDSASPEDKPDSAS